MPVFRANTIGQIQSRSQHRYWTVGWSAQGQQGATCNVTPPVGYDLVAGRRIHRMVNPSFFGSAKTKDKGSDNHGVEKEGAHWQTDEKRFSRA